MDEKLQTEKWGINNKVKATIFEGIYNKNISSKNFIDTLLNYADDSKKCYWIGIYLFDDYYTNIKNIDLSILVLKKGLDLSLEEWEKTFFYWMIGYQLFLRQKRRSKKLFIKSR